jgi:hypothetical protein
MTEYVKGKSKNELLDALVNTAEPGSRAHEQQKMGIIVRSVEDLEKSLGLLKDSMNENAKSSTALAKKVFWLNLVLTFATVIGTFLLGIRFSVRILGNNNHITNRLR